MKIYSKGKLTQILPQMQCFARKEDIIVHSSTGSRMQCICFLIISQTFDTKNKFSAKDQENSTI